MTRTMTRRTAEKTLRSALADYAETQFPGKWDTASAVLMIPGEEPGVLTVVPDQVDPRPMAAEQVKHHAREFASMFHGWEHLSLIVSRGLKRPVEMLLVWNE